MKIIKIDIGGSGYPLALAKYLGDRAPKSISGIGNVDILHHQKLAIFCSAKCPGNLILQTYDLAQKLREEGITVISGFSFAYRTGVFEAFAAGHPADYPLPCPEH